MRFISLLIVLVLTSCVSVPDINRALFAIDAEWQRDYDKIARTEGTRYYPIPRDVAMELLAVTLQDMGMLIVQRDYGNGLVIAESLAPKPLTDQEWNAVALIEEPRMQQIVADTIGPLSASLFTLEPSEYGIRLGAQIVGDENVSRIAIEGRLVYIGGVKGLYEQKYIPPLAVLLGSEKIWSNLKRNLEAAGLGTKPIEKPPGFSA